VAMTEGWLSNVPPGETVTIAAVRAGRGLNRRMADLGLNPGVRVKVVSGGRPGPVVLDVGGVKLALGHGVVRRIMVVYPVETGK
jgi:ferrous iron transport protein A